MSHRTRTSIHSWRERALSLLLAAALLVGLAPGAIPAASAHWADPYLDQLVDWGVMRADQTSDPDSPITRADFAAVINRAYGYDKMGPIPFTDVSTTDWFYDDIAIAYNAGYMAGTSGTTASPNSPLTREMAVCILGRNMMLRETPGESLAFSDSRDISGWARGTIKTAVDNYIVSGYPDNTFGPQDPITKGQMAVLVTQCVGQPVSESGSHSLGGVFGNVTITSPNVTLHDTTISGDLYISGGVGLGGILLQNVDVLGRIIVSGTGESETGAASVVMRNVTATEMLVDNLKNQYVTIRADGITQIGTTTVRTPSYLEDNNTDDKGLMEIVLDGEPGTRLDLAGRIKEVVNKTPNSIIQVAKGTVKKLTVDEDATSSTVQIDRNTEVKELNLDVGTNVVGDGDIGQLNVNAPGSTVSMLPDKIYIRPGLTANIAGVIMDHLSAEQGSTDPRLLSGYPAAKDIAPTGFRADFSGNKAGTIYWAVSSISDGSINEEDLISPPSYGSRAVRNGSVSVPAGDTVISAQVTGLTTGGSYYLSAILVDGMDQRSPVKVVSFTTPDNSVPAFAQGYPYMSMVTDTEAQVTIMPTKNCKMYYAVLPRGAQAPTTNELKSAAVSNNLGYGVVDVYKNKEEPFMVSRRLEELKDYTLYLWLTDSNGANSSAVIPVQFTTKDMTPPQFTVPPYVNQIQATAVRLAGTLNENGTVYWAVVERGTAYPKPQPGVPNLDENGDPLPYAALDSDYAKLQVSAGMNCLRSGSVTVRKDTEFTFNVTGLTAEKTYDLYYLAKDLAGNFSVRVEKLEIHTQDNSGPVITQSFSEYTGLDNTQNPLPSTDIILEFSEDVICTNDGWGGLSFLALATNTPPAESDRWPNEPKEVLATALRNSIELYQIRDGREQRVAERDDTNASTIGSAWTIDYRNATVKAGDGGKIQVIFPTNSTDTSKSALNLASGATYFFRFRDLVDTAPEQNKINPHPLDYARPGAELHKVPAFTTVFAQVNLTSPGVDTDVPFQRDANGVPTTTDEYVDLSFRMDPDATEKVEDNNSYDILLYSDTVTRYNLYYRIRDNKTQKPITDPYTYTNENGVAAKDFLVRAIDAGENDKPDSRGWFYLGDSQDVNPAPDWSGRSVNGFFNGCLSRNFPRVNQLGEDFTYEFVIALTQYGTSKNRPTWNGQINFEVHVVAGQSNSLYRLSTNPNKPSLEQFLKDGLENGGVVSIGINRTQNYLPLRGSFIDSQLPKFNAGYPQFQPGDSFATMQFNLTRAGTIYYVVAEDKVLAPTISGVTGAEAIWNEIPESGEDLYDADGKLNPDVYKEVSSPVSGDIFNPMPYRSSAHCGNVAYPGGMLTLDKILNRESNETLKPNTKYYVYLVLKGVADELSPVYTFKFETGDTEKPKITLFPRTTGAVNVVTQVPSNLSYRLFTSIQGNAIDLLKGTFVGDNTDTDTTKHKILPTAYANKSVLWAMSQTYSSNTASSGNQVTGAYIPTGYDGYSVFDVYASDALKERVAWLIREGRESGAATTIDEGDDTTDGTARGTDVKLNNMKAQTPYLFLSVAYHTSSEEIIGDSFKAVDQVYILDPDAPELLSHSTNSDAVGGATPPTNPISGTVTINFDKDLYWVSASTGGAAGTQKVVDQSTTDGDENRDAIGIANVQHTAPGGGTLGVQHTVKGPSRTFEIKFSDMRIGSTITLFRDGSISNADGQTTNKQLTLTLTWGQMSSQSGIALYGAYFVADWGGETIPPTLPK